MYAAQLSCASAIATTTSMNRLFALRIFSQRVPLATRVEPPSTTADWVWNALDIARHAANADDLEHLSAIKGAADYCSSRFGCGTEIREEMFDTP